MMRTPRSFRVVLGLLALTLLGLTLFLGGLSASATAPRLPQGDPPPAPEELESWEDDEIDQRGGEIIDELVELELIPDDGELGVVEDFVFIDIANGGLKYLGSFAEDVEYENFVLSFRTVFEDGDEGSGCGFLYRFEEDDLNGYAGYAFIYAEGWVWLADDEVEDEEYYLYYGPETVEISDDEQNYVLLVANGDRVIMFVNGVLVGDMEFPEREGGVKPAAEMVLDNPTYCEFENIWVWEF